MDFKKAYDANREKRTETPLLAKQATVVTLNGAGSRVSVAHLALQCTDGQAVNIALNAEITYAMLNMMQAATHEAGWDLITSAESATMQLAQQNKAFLH
jgi:hypothetical protein